MTEYEISTLSLIVKPKGKPIYDEQTTIIEMTDEAAGPFITLKQCNDDSQKGEVRLDPAEWPAICKAIEAMIEICNDEQKNSFDERAI
jgi:hypothetical protein